MRLSEVATRLRVLATDSGCRELNDLADELDADHPANEHELPLPR